MKRLITGILAAAALIACKPETYTGPLDSPIGSWDGVKAEYYFNGELVGQVEECQYSAISFYKEGLCCIEGVKGTFPYTYEHSSGTLVIDNTIWTGSIFENKLTLPIEYKGISINADDYGYYYEDGQGDKTYCNYHSSKDETGAPVIDFWYDTHTDYFIPLIVEVKK